MVRRDYLHSDDALSTRSNRNVIGNRCGPCKTISPVFEQLATSHSSPGKLAFAKVDTDRNSDIAGQYGISAYVNSLSPGPPFTETKI
jgi:thiol-disulfide isomerase/thioredoxin